MNNKGSQTKPNSYSNTNSDHSKPSVQSTSKLSILTTVVLSQSPYSSKACLQRLSGQSDELVVNQISQVRFLPAPRIKHQEPWLQIQTHGRHAHTDFLLCSQQMHQLHSQLSHVWESHQQCLLKERKKEKCPSSMNDLRTSRIDIPVYDMHPRRTITRRCFLSLLDRQFWPFHNASKRAKIGIHGIEEYQGRDLRYHGQWGDL